MNILYKAIQTPHLQYISIALGTFHKEERKKTKRGLLFHIDTGIPKPICCKQLKYRLN